jgi:hypothetical protein
LLAKFTGPAVVGFAVQDIPCYLISSNSLTQLVYVNIFVVLDKVVLAIDLIHVFQKPFESTDKTFIRRTSQEL